MIKGDEYYDKESLTCALTKVGVQKGDIVFSHVGIGFLGQPRHASTPDAVATLIDDAFAEVLGPEGTLLVPTYTYSFCNGEDYDAATSPSTVGYFTEWYRKQPGILRSREPIFSVAAGGRRAAELLKDLPSTSFGKDCIYDRLVKAGASICNVGVGFRYATFIHYVEKTAGVPYRFDKTFSGNIIEGKKKEPATWEYYVRTAVDDQDSWPDLTRLEDDVRKSGLLHEAPVGRSVVTRIACKDLLEAGVAAIKRNPWYLARGFSTHVY